jgi:hypothetical protein
VTSWAIAAPERMASENDDGGDARTTLGSTSDSPSLKYQF